ncbi:MAG: hypothetical protein Q7I99_05685 [Acholeplasmataceae bacterium]|nr:hypothetical protein [Acholeplasmataceae bacterium]
MKHFIFYFSVLVLTALMVLVIRNNEIKVSPKMITVAKYYSYLYSEDQMIKIPIYLNVKDHPLSVIESYEQTYIANDLETKKLALELVSIEAFGMESYLNDAYQIYHLTFKMPYLGYDYYIEDCFLTMILGNDQIIKAYIGKMSLVYLEGDSNLLHWTSLSGIKKENSFLSRIYEIHVRFDRKDSNIEQIMIGYDLDVTYKIENSIIIITIPEESYLLDNVFLLITFSNNERQGIMNFRYITDYYILKESGPLIYTYALD